MPKYVRSIPSALALGISRGTKTSIITAASRKQPSARKNMFTTTMNISGESCIAEIAATRLSASRSFAIA